eukprot:gene10295-21488_t
MCRGYHYHCDISCNRLKGFGNMFQGKQTLSKADGSRITFSLCRSSAQSPLRNTIMTRKSSDFEDPGMDVIDKLKAVHAGGDFGKLLTEGSTFVDKSLFIKEIIDDKSEVILITMPRRWGKSLNMDMLRQFLSIETDVQSGLIIPHNTTNNYKIFNNTKLQITFNNKCMRHHGKWPVIFLNLKDCKKNDYTAIEITVRKKLIDLYLDFGYLARSSKIYSGDLTVKERYQSLLKELRDEVDFSSKLEELTKLLYIFHNNTKVWILIDEYDAAANHAYMTMDADEAQKVSDLFAAFLEPALKDNKYLQKSVVTGVQYIVKSGMLSGLNNFEQYSILDPRYSQYYGLNQKEMDLLLFHFDITDAKQIYNIKNWYNGYSEMLPDTTSTEYISKYNIWSVIRYLNNQKKGFKSFWEESGGLDFITPLFNNEDVKEKVTTLVGGGSISFSLISDFSESTKILQAILDMPKAISSNEDRAKFIKDSFITKFRATFQSLIETCRLFASSDSTEGIYANEDAIHSILNVVSFNLFNCFIGSEMYINKSDELDSKKGRADLVIRGISTGIIIEIKYSKKEYSENVNSVQKALKQAKSYSNLVIGYKEKIFIALCVSESKNVSIAGEIQIGDNCYSFPDTQL